MTKTLQSNYYRAGQWNWTMENLYIYSGAGLDLGGFVHLRAKNINIKGTYASGQSGCKFESYCRDIEIDGMTITDPGNYALAAYYGADDFRIINLTTSGAGTAAIDLYNADLKLLNPSIAEATKVADVKRYGRLARINDGGVAGTHIISTYNGTIQSEASVRHTASGIAWKLSPTNTGLSGRMFIPADYVAGITTEQSVWVADSADVYRQYTLTVTPSEDGVIEVWVEARGGTTYSLYVDDFSVV